MEERGINTYILITIILTLIVMMGIGLYMSQGQKRETGPEITPKIVYQNDKNIVIENENGNIEVKLK